MRLYTLSLVAILAISALLYGCGGASGINPQQTGNQGQNTVTIPPGPGMPQVTGDDVQLTPDGKITSNAYSKFFADSVNEHSWGRWNAIDGGGQKKWTLSNTYNSAPKSFLLGGNYWNNENQSLFSNPFQVPFNTDGVRITFTARWKIAAGDSCSVIYNEMQHAPLTVANFTGGQNPDYPGFTKYYFELPANTNPGDEINSIEFFFYSNSSGTDFGFALDDVAVYQRLLDPPTGLDASDGGPAILVTWNNTQTGNLIPDGTEIWRSTTSGSNYSLQASVNYPGNSWTDPTAVNGVIYYYVVRHTKVGWQPSSFSKEDQGDMNFP